MIVFPDTHLFLHFRDLRELPWDEVISDPEISIVVGRTVQKELEKKRYELRGRPQDRARTYARKLAEIVDAGTPFVVREHSPRITLDFVSRPSGWTTPDDLAPAWQDDQIVADVLAYKMDHPKESVAILTGDAGLTATSRSHHILVLKPGTSWEMPSEASPEEKEIKKLQREVSELQKRGPSISVELMSSGNESIKQVELSFDWYTSLSEVDISTLINEVTTRHPLTEKFDILPNGQVASEENWAVPDEAAIEAYKAEHAQWLKDTISFIRRIAEGSTRADIRSEFEIWLRNVGVEPANGMRFLLRVTDGLLLWSDQSADGDSANDQPKSQAAKDEILSAQPFRRPPLAPAPRRLRPPSPAINKFENFSRVDAGFLGRLKDQEKFLRNFGVISTHQAKNMLGVADTFGLKVSEAQAFARPIVDLPSIVPYRPEPRDPRAFYWRTKSADKEGATEWELECEEYAHLDEAEVFAFALSKQITEGKRFDGSLQVRASANNLRRPVDVTFQVRIICKQADTLTRLRGLLPL